MQVAQYPGKTIGKYITRSRMIFDGILLISLIDEHFCAISPMMVQGKDANTKWRAISHSLVVTYLTDAVEHYLTSRMFSSEKM